VKTNTNTNTALDTDPALNRVVSIENELRLFDALPRVLRDALNYATENYCVRDVAVLYHKQRKSVAEILRFLK